jgi:DNA-binding NarL/FixJ family response regulator
MQSATIRVAVVDDNDMLRYGMSVVLEAVEDISFVGEARSGAEALELCGRVNPDVILVDLVMPEMSGVVTIQKIREAMPHIRCIALTSFDEAQLVRDALDAGAISYLIKNLSLDALAQSIRDAYAGKSTLSDEAVKALGNGDERQATP